jgi:hypothetical protein
MAKTSAAPSFESILDTPAAGVERPKPLPIGTYTAVIKGLYEEITSSKTQTPGVQFTFALTSAGEDVDAEELEALGGITDKFLKNNSTTFWTTPTAAWRLTEFLEQACQIDLEGKTIRQALGDTPNTEVRLVIIHEANQSGDQKFASVKKFLPVE